MIYHIEDYIDGLCAPELLFSNSEVVGDCTYLPEEFLMNTKSKTI